MTLFAAATRALGARAGGRGSFAADASVLAFGQTAPMVVLFWAPDMVCYLLRVPEERYQRLVPFYGGAAAAWAFGLSVAGVVSTERLGVRRALPVVAASEALSAVLSGVSVAMR